MSPLGLPAQDYGSTTNAASSPTSQRQPYPAAPGLPVHFGTDQEQHGAVWRTVVVSAIMCLLLAGTDHRLLNGVLLESTSWLADACLLYTRLLLSDLLWSIVVGSITAFVLPPLGFLIAVDWLIPGRPITYLALHGQSATTYFFYSFLLLILAWAPPLLPLRWALEWILSLGSGVQRDQVTT